MEKSATRGVLISLLAYAFYACSDASVKSLRGAIPPMEAVFILTALGLLAFPFVRRTGERWSDAFRCNHWGFWLLRTVASVVGGVSSVTCFTLLPMAEAFSLLFLMPTFITILSVLFLKESVGWRRWSAVVVGFVGVLIVLRPGFRELGLGHLAALIGGFSAAVSVVLIRARGARETRISLYGAGVFGPLIASGLIMAPHFVLPQGTQWLLLASYGLLAVIASVLVMQASVMAPASLTAPTQYSQMLWAIGFGYLLFNDGLDGWMFVGAAVIIGSGFFIFLRERKRHPGETARTPPTMPQT